MTDSQRLYMKTYMRRYRANGGPQRARVRRRLMQHHAPPRVFVPLKEQRHGHCAFCGLRSYETICGFCKRELEGAAA